MLASLPLSCLYLPALRSESWIPSTEHFRRERQLDISAQLGRLIWVVLLPGLSTHSRTLRIQSTVRTSSPHLHTHIHIFYIKVFTERTQLANQFECPIREAWELSCSQDVCVDWRAAIRLAQVLTLHDRGAGVEWISSVGGAIGAHQPVLCAMRLRQFRVFLYFFLPIYSNSSGDTHRRSLYKRLCTWNSIYLLEPQNGIWWRKEKRGKCWKIK